MSDMDERVTTERILRRMTDPVAIAEKERRKKEADRVKTIRNKHSL
jgi:hypothetical protein